MKAIVVGAGIGGLATALRLANANHSVDVYEQSASLGGKLNVFNQNGYRFDAGPSLFTLPHLVEELVALSKAHPDRFQYHTLDRSCHYFWDDGTRFTAWFDKEALANEIKTKLGVDPTPTLRHLDHSAFLYDTTSALFMERSLHRWKSYVSKDVIKALVNVFKLDLTTSMHAANRRTLNHPKLVQLFDRYATYNGSDPYRAPGVLNIIPHLEHNIGTFLPKGGMYSITETVAELAREKGVRFHLNAPVKRIVTDNGMAKGIETENGFVAADVVVSNADVFTTYRHLLPQEAAPGKVLERERSTSALIFYWGIAHSFEELHLHNIFFSNDYAEEFELLKAGKRISDDPTVYINITSKLEPNDAPPGHENWFVMINVPAHFDQDWDTLIPEARAAILAKLSKVLGMDVEPLITTEALLEPRTIESKTASHRGALYGTASNDRMAAFLRHPNFSRSIKGLYFCGGSVHPGGGIPLCLLSARIVHELIESDHA